MNAGLIMEAAKKIPWEQAVKKAPEIFATIGTIWSSLSSIDLPKMEKKVTLEEFRSTIEEMQGIMEGQTKVIQELAAQNEALIEKIGKMTVQLNIALVMSIIAVSLSIILFVR